MAKKNTRKRISVNAFEKAYKGMGRYTGDKTLSWGDMEFTICPTLSLSNMMQYVREVVQGCFIGDDAEFHPEVQSFLNNAAVIAYYTNIALPSNTAKTYEMLCNSGELIDLIVKNVNHWQYESIQKAIYERLQNHNSVATSIAIRQLETVSAAVEGLESKFAEMFDGVNGDDLNTAIKAIGENGFNEETLVKAIMKNRGATSDENELGQH